MSKTVIKISILSCIIALILFGCGGRESNQGKPAFVPSDAQLAAFEKRMEQLVTQLNLNNLSAVLVNNREIVWNKNRGVSDVPTALNTPYQIGALTNIFIPVIIVQLMEEGKLDLNDPVMKYLKDYNGKASIKHLLSHTSEGKPANTFNYNQQEFAILADIIKQASGKSLKKLLAEKIIDELGLQNCSFNANTAITEGISASLTDLTKFSQAIDDTLFFEDKEMAKYLFRPMYLVTGERTPCSIGWFVQYYRHIKLCWNFGSGKDFSSLLIKEPNQQLTLILLSKSEQMNKPFALQEGDLLNSPIALSFLKTFFFDSDTLPDIDFQADMGTIKAQFDTTKSTGFRDLYLQELLTQIKLYQSQKDNSTYNQLLNIYENVYPNELSLDYINRRPLAEISNVHDSYFVQREFSLDNKTDILIFAVGEKVSGITYNDPWQDDNIEIYFDMKNEKTANFDGQGDDRQYRVQWDRKEFTGMNIPTENIIFKQSDPSETEYMVELQFPWKTVGFVTPRSGLKIGFDVIIGDNDGADQRKGSKAWHTERNIAYQNTSVYGNLQLKSSHGGGISDSIAFAGWTAQKPVIDGKRDAVWNTASAYPLGKIIEGTITNDRDLSADFRAMWDNTNLYLLICVNDNIKYSRPNAMYADYGWIENITAGDTVWMMTDEKIKPAGGDQRNIRVEKRLQLDAGDYLLRYISNGTHSYDHWVADRPETSLYGIIVYEEEK